jgi:predicted phosphodiesterase
MTLTRIIGDIHGKLPDYQLCAIGDFKGPTIQVGDFGIGFGGDYWDELANEFHADGTHRFIRGNHDKPAQCKSEMVGYISDGTVENDVMFIGGAWSIDNPNAPPGWYRRTADVDWWADEECTNEEFLRFAEMYSIMRPRVMITHDCPWKVSKEMFFNSGFINGVHYPTRTGAFLDKLMEIHQPDFHFFGHWHTTMQYKYGNTIFVCLGELDTIDVDLEDSDQIHQAIFDKFNT